MGSENHRGFAPFKGPISTQDQTVMDEVRPGRAGSEQGPPAGAEPDYAAITRRAFATAESIFTSTADDLTQLSLKVARGDLEELGEAVKQARALRAAASTLMDERNRVDKLRKDVGGGCGGAGNLDLDAARAEIGRRLACLRRASGG